VTIILVKKSLVLPDARTPLLEHVHSAGGLSCNAASISIETLLVVLNSPQSVCK